VRVLLRSAALLAAGVLSLGVAQRAAVAGPWVDPKAGHGFVSLSYARYSADEYFTGHGEVLGPLKLEPGTKQAIGIPFPGGFATVNYNSNYVDQSVLLYGEVTLGARFAAVVSMPVMRYITQDIASVPDPAKLSQLNAGDLNVGIKYQVPLPSSARGFAFGPQLYLTAPTGDKNGRAAFPDGIALKPLPLPTGNGTFDLEARGSFGYSFYPIPVFIVADLGYRHRLNQASCNDSSGGQATVNYSDDLPWSVQVGATWAPKKKWFDHGTLIATVHGIKSIENGDVPGENGLPSKGSPYTQTCGQANNATSLSLGGTLMLFPIKWFGITYTIEHTLTGINTGYGLSNIVGFATEF